MKKIILFIGILILSACGGSSHSQTGQLSGSVSDDQAEQSSGVIELNSGLSTEQALSVISQNGQSPQVEVSTSWSEYISTWELSAGSVAEQKTQLIQKEKDQLDFLVKQFDPNDADEGEVYQNLTAIRKSLETTGEIPIDSLKVSLSDLPKNIDSNSLVSNVQRFDENTIVEKAATVIPEKMLSVAAATMGVDKSQCDPSRSPVCDYINDGVTVPNHGSIQVSNNGSVMQKFKLDKEAVQWFKDHGGGVEIKTLYHLPTYGGSYNDTREKIQCGYQWNTNMAGTKNKGITSDETKGRYVYRDTEAFDGITSPEYTICSIGHLDATKLKANILYFTWRDLKQFDVEVEDDDPRVIAEWAPTRQLERDCVNPPAPQLCWLGYIAWCNCTRTDMPTEHLVTYQYDDYVGEKVKWYKNPSYSVSSVDSSDMSEEISEAEVVDSSNTPSSSTDSESSESNNSESSLPNPTAETSSSSSSSNQHNYDASLDPILLFLLDDED